MKLHPTLPVRQRGAILIVSLLLLLVMTVLALTASQTTRLQERMAGNARDMDLAFQAAEAGLRAAEVSIDTVAESNGRKGIPTCAEITADCQVADRPLEPTNLDTADETWWDENSISYGDPGVKEFANLKTDPNYHIEVWTEVGDTLTEGQRLGQKTGITFYAVTSRALGGTDTTETVVQSVYASPWVR